MARHPACNKSSDNGQVTSLFPLIYEQPWWHGFLLYKSYSVSRCTLWTLFGRCLPVTRGPQSPKRYEYHSQPYWPRCVLHKPGGPDQPAGTARHALRPHPVGSFTISFSEARTSWTLSDWTWMLRMVACCAFPCKIQAEVQSQCRWGGNCFVVYILSLQKWVKHYLRVWQKAFWLSDHIELPWRQHFLFQLPYPPIPPSFGGLSKNSDSPFTIPCSPWAI